MNKIFTKLKVVLLLVTGGMSIVSAQVYKKIGDNPFTLKPTAALEIESTTKGFLPPRVDRVDNNTSASSITTKPATGLVVYSKADWGLMVNIGTPDSPNWKSTQLPSEPAAKIVTDNIEIAKVTTSGVGVAAVSTTDYSFTTVLANANAKPITITLPLPSVAGDGKIYTVGKIDSSSNVVKINTTAGSAGAGLILSKTNASSPTYVTISELNYPASFRVQSDGTNWYIID